jgi:chromosome segregation ATPase
MDEQKALLKRIVGKIKALKERYEEQAATIRTQEKAIQELKARIRQLENELKTKNNDKSIYSQSPGIGKNLSTPQREDIEKLVREIDHCLKLLGNNYHNKE